MGTEVMKNKVKDFVQLVADLDEAAEQYGNDSKEADAIRDQMEKPWYALSMVEQEDVRTIIALQDACDSKKHKRGVMGG